MDRRSFLSDLAFAGIGFAVGFAVGVATGAGVVTEAYRKKPQPACGGKFPVVLHVCDDSGWGRLVPVRCRRVVMTAGPAPGTVRATCFDACFDDRYRDDITGDGPKRVFILSEAVSLASVTIVPGPEVTATTPDGGESPQFTVLELFAAPDPAVPRPGNPSSGDAPATPPRPGRLIPKTGF